MELQEPRYVFSDGKLRRVVEVLQDAELSQLQTLVDERQAQLDSLNVEAETLSAKQGEAERLLEDSKRHFNVAQTVVGNADDETEPDGVLVEVANPEAQPVGQF